MVNLARNIGEALQQPYEQHFFIGVVVGYKYPIQRKLAIRNMGPPIISVPRPVKLICLKN
jgi:hypothetical protein